MQNTPIEWCDHTFNPWIGCTKVSPGCAHCYAEARDQRFANGAHWGVGSPRQRTTPDNWKKPLDWNGRAGMVNRVYGEAGDTSAPVRPRVFCASLADWLDKEVPVEWLADLMLLIHQTPNLDWLLLSKRPHLWRQRVSAAQDKLRNVGSIPRDSAAETMDRWIGGEPPRNVWIGTTVEDQTRANERIPQLLRIPARVRFLSCEPLLGPLELGLVEQLNDAVDGSPMVDWVICGGESGHGARPMHPDCARSLRDQCAAAGVPFLFKQWGEHLHERLTPVSLLAKSPSFVTVERENFYRVGKQSAGRLLDDRTHDEFPTAEVRQ